MKILMGTKNPGKIEGAKQAFEKYFESIEIEGVWETLEKMGFVICYDNASMPATC